VHKGIACLCKAKCHTIIALSTTDPLLIYDKVMEGDEGFDGVLGYFPNTFTPKKIQPEFSVELTIVCNDVM